jgi:hypothetical protein
MHKWQSTLAFGFILIVSAAVFAQTADQQKIAGRWEGQRQAEGRLDNMAFVFDVTAKGVTGTAFYNGQEFSKLDTITVAGNTVTFNVTNMSFTGVLDEKTGTTMKLTAHFDGRDLWDLTVTRKKKQ